MKFPCFTAHTFAEMSCGSYMGPLNELCESRADGDEAAIRRIKAKSVVKPQQHSFSVISGPMPKPPAVLCLSDGALLMLPWAH